MSCPTLTGKMGWEKLNYKFERESTYFSIPSQEIYCLPTPLAQSDL
jgi:hypothetical protein